MGGTVGLWRNDDANTTSFKLAPEIGYNLSEQWALGVELQFNHEYKEHISTNTFAIAPYARFSYFSDSDKNNPARRVCHHSPQSSTDQA